MKKNRIKLFLGCMAIGLFATQISCTDAFLKQDPLSFYEPTATYTTEAVF